MLGKKRNYAFTKMLSECLCSSFMKMHPIGMNFQWSYKTTVKSAICSDHWRWGKDSIPNFVVGTAIGVSGDLYCSCLPWEEQATWLTSMSSARPKGRIADKIARAFRKLSHLWPPLVSSSNSSADGYIAKTNADSYVYVNPVCNFNRW